MTRTLARLNLEKTLEHLEGETYRQTRAVCMAIISNQGTWAQLVRAWKSVAEELRTAPLIPEIWLEQWVTLPPVTAQKRGIPGSRYHLWWGVNEVDSVDWGCAAKAVGLTSE